MFHFHNITYLGEVNIFYTCLKNSSCFNTAKILKIDRNFPMLWHTCTVTFLWFTLYVQFIQFLSSLHTYNKDAVFPQWLPVHANISYLRSKKLQASGGLCSQTPWPGTLPLDPAGGTSPTPHHLHPNTCYFSPNPGRLDKTLATSADTTNRKLKSNQAFCTTCHLTSSIPRTYVSMVKKSRGSG